MKQTAVDYIKEKLQGYGFDFGYVLDVAKEMEKEQMINFAENYEMWESENYPRKTFEQYYNETFNKSIKNKG